MAGEDGYDAPGDVVDLGIPGLGPAVEAARGGFATVYRAEQAAFRRTVAVKVLDRRLDAVAAGRFDRERAAMGVLGDHPCILTVFDGGTTTTGHPYLLMPFCANGSLQDVLDRGERVPWPRALEVGVLMAGALAAAHRAGVLHRDVKPANVLLSRYGEPLLADFGIARITGGQETTSGSVTASIAHAAPEILDGRRPTERSDVYSLASTLWTLVAGGPPFASATDESVVPLIARVLTQPVPDLPADAPPELTAELRRGMAKDPGQRHEDAAAFGAALQHVQERCGVARTPLAVELGGSGEERPVEARSDSVRPTPPARQGDLPHLQTVAVGGPAGPGAPPVAAPVGGDGGLPPAGADAARPTRRRRGVMVAAIAALAIGGGLAAFVLLRSGATVVEGPPVDALAREDIVPEVELDPQVRRLDLGEPVRDTLGVGEGVAYRFEAPRGRYLRMRMTALQQQLDPLAAVFDASGAQVAYDDDSGGGEFERDALYEGFALGEGPLTVVAAPYAAQTGGDYELLVEAPDEAPLDARADGELLDGGWAAAVYTFESTAGDVAFIDVVSEDFDPILTIVGPDGREVSSDAAEGDGAAHLEGEAPLTGTYALVVTTGDGGVGTFEVELSRG